MRNGVDPINALQPLRRHLQIMDRTDLGQKTAQRLNMDRADGLLGLGKPFRGFSGHFDEFYDLHRVMCFCWLDDLPCAACKDFVVFVIRFLSTRTNRMQFKGIPAEQPLILTATLSFAFGAG